MFTRRQLLTSGSAAFAATVLRAQAPGKPRRPIKIAVKYDMIKEGGTVLEKFKIAKEAGFDGIEPNGPLDETSFAGFAEAIKTTGIQVPGLVCAGGGRDMGSLDPDVRARGIETMKQTLRQSAALGGTTVLMYPGVVNKETPYHLVYQALLASTRAALPVARETGVKIALENVWNNLFLSPLDAVHFIDTLNDPHVGWFFDIGNVARYGWPEHWIRALGKRILKLDIKGYSTTRHLNEGPWAGFKTEIGEDEIDWAAVMQALDEIPYAGGWISAEVGGGPLSRLIQVRQQIDNILSL